MDNETRKSAVLIAAAIIAAIGLTGWDCKRSPRLVAGVANAIEKAKFLVSALEAKGLSRNLVCFRQQNITASAESDGFPAARLRKEKRPSYALLHCAE